MSDDVVTAGGAAGGSGVAGRAAGGETPELTFVEVTDPEHIAELANFADGIFREHFSKLHSPEKVDYLCHYLLGTGTLISAIADEGYEYYFADVAGSGEGAADGGSGEGEPAGSGGSGLGASGGSWAGADGTGTSGTRESALAGAGGMTHAGFVGFQPREDYLFLSKLYLAKEWRGKGLGRAEFEFVKSRARELALPKIRLTCARDNRSSIAAYHHLGCEIVGEADTEVAEGIEMNDYLIEYVL